MTVADLIRELQRMPQHQPVRVVSGLVRLNEHELQHALQSGGLFMPHEIDATEADDVQPWGSFVLVRGR
jgi:hypothetical protein